MSTATLLCEREKRFSAKERSTSLRKREASLLNDFGLKRINFDTKLLVRCKEMILHRRQEFCAPQAKFLCTAGMNVCATGKIFFGWTLHRRQDFFGLVLIGSIS